MAQIRKRERRTAVPAEVEVAPEPQEQPEEQPKIRVSAVVVSHNRDSLLRRCLEALERSTIREEIEILVVDNGSRDGTPLLELDFPRVRFIRLPRNFGLTKALNIGIRAAQGDFVLLLHEDTEVFPDTVSALAARLEFDSEAGAVCPRLVDAEEKPAAQLSRLPRPDQPESEWRPAEPGAEPMAVEYPRGAIIMLRLFFLKAMRQIDERYGLYWSDAELAAQVRRAAKKILLLPSALAIHHGGRQAPDPRTRALWSADRDLGRARFIGKYYGFAHGLRLRIAVFFIYLVSAFGSMLRLHDVRYHFARLPNAVSGQKVDGSQPGA